MIKLKLKTVNYDKIDEEIRVDFQTRRTNTLEHLCAMNTLLKNIIREDENIKDIDEVFELLKDLYEIRKEDDE